MKPHEADGGLNEVTWRQTMSYKEKQIFQCWTKYARPTSVTRSEFAALARRIYCANSIRPRLHGSRQFLQGKKLARSHPAFTRDRRNWTRFWTAKCASLGPEKKKFPNLHTSFFQVPNLHTYSRSKIRPVPPVPCERKVGPCQFPSV